MKFYVFALMLLFTVSNCSFALDPAPSDAEVCSNVLSKAAENVLARYNLPSGKTVRLTSGPGNKLSNQALETIEALITDHGCSIAGNTPGEDVVIDISLTDVSIILLKQNRLYHRNIRLTVHMNFLDSEGTMLFSSKSSESASDVIPVKQSAMSDDGYKFEKNIERILITGNRIKIMAATLLMFTGILAYFAFQ